MKFRRSSHSFPQTLNSCNLNYIRQKNFEDLNTLLKLSIRFSAANGAATDTLARVLEGVCRPLKVRVEQVLVSEPGTLILYKLTTLLKFYHSTIR